MEIEEKTDCFSCQLTFPNRNEPYQVSELADLLNDLSRMYAIAVEYTCDKEARNIEESFSSPYDQVESTLAFKEYVRERSLQARAQVLSQITDKKITLSGQEIDVEMYRYFPTKAEINGFLLIDSDPTLRVLSINYNSPLQVTFAGLARPLILAVILCGGEIDIMGARVIMPGVVDALIKINEAFVPKNFFTDAPEPPSQSKE
ncbi:hypothetical protein VIBNISOn1_1280070 [Vibrio nigripulchritudo SOn1]|uniref:Uncharacterized protein n=1 Tax=Vibrio nigripulchritudo SOn1 TaxID=1238450 RepID=A0AAV2VJS3_9VIBR|nr:hypothetical protein [Vibrio nigripulchritudo]KJY81007.1 hypothetical protein TW74_01550 [Vibrio nigripulchritudo]CCO44921.1 hypothetical protein VIBNISOn1_1280070 [Vibrio nigripulchritudo SOn1]